MVNFLKIDDRVGFKISRQARNLVRKLEGIYCNEGKDYFFCEVTRYLPQMRNIEEMKSAGFEVIIDFSTLKLIKERTRDELNRVYTIKVEKEGERALLVFDTDAHQAYKEVEKLSSIKYNVQSSYAGWAEKTIELSNRLHYGDEIVYSVPWWLLRGLIYFYEKRGYTLDVPKEFMEVRKLPYELEKKFDLYGFQAEAYNRWLQAEEFGTIVIPTGGGKTFVALQSIVGKPVNTLICVITEQLMNQWGRMLEELCGIPPSEIGYYFARKHEIKPVTIGMYHSLATNIVRKNGKQLREFFDRVIFDEGHHVAAKTFKNVAFNLQSQIRMCLSATPERWDGNENLIYFASGGKCYFIDYPSLVEQKIVAPLEKFTYIVPLTKDEKKAMESVEKRGKIRRGTYLKFYHQKARIDLQAKNKLDALIKILTKHRGDKCFIFTRYLWHVDMISQHLRRRGIHHRVLTGSTPEKERRDFFQEFRKGKAKIIVTTTVLDEGVDVPDASVSIIMGGSGQPRQMIQRTGRVCRYEEGKTAFIYEVIADHDLERRLHLKRTATGIFGWEDKTELLACMG
jgi:superfamily II DNA or RNA helicase